MPNSTKNKLLSLALLGTMALSATTGNYNEKPVVPEEPRIVHSWNGEQAPTGKKQHKNMFPDEPVHNHWDNYGKKRRHNKKGRK